VRSENLSPKSRGPRGSNSALIDAPEESFAPKSRSVRPSEPSPRRDFAPSFAEDFADSLPNPTEDDGFDYRRQRSGYKLRFRGRVLQVPKTFWGRIFGACALLVLAGCFAAALMALRSFFLHDSRFVIASSSSIQIAGNTHLSRAQLLSVFGEDVERNIFNVPLAARRAELEQLPWVAHATVMRLLPNHLRIAVTERTPVAFVRQGTQIGMVDANGVLLDIPPAAAPSTSEDPHYSFPVVTGIGSADPLSTRAARMKIYTAFTGDLDSTGNHISEKLSEVDLSNPEDVKALIPEGSSDVLVHFGDTDFLSRYQKFQQHLAEWRTQYPKLASIDMRYDRQVVLEMQPGTPTPAPASGTSVPVKADAPATKPAAKLAGKSAAKTPAKGPVRPALKKPAPIPPAPTSAPASTSQEWHMVVVKPHTKAKAAAPAKAKPAHPSQAAAQ
jgi:cell division protein FtsQ